MATNGTRVSDNGKGFSRTVTNGYGLGLHAMKYRADLIGAELRIEFGPARGLASPAHCASKFESYKPIKNSQKMNAPQEIPSRKQILVVDDHPMMRAGLTQLISKQSSMEVCREASSPAEAMTRIHHRLDLIIADLTMKEGGGLEFIKDVRALYENIPVLVVSMHDEKSTRSAVCRQAPRATS